jgi:hypothetical protein
MRIYRVRYNPLLLFPHVWLKVMHMCSLRCMDLAASRRNLADVAAALRAAGVPFWLSEGTALGARRQGDLIPGDDDVDIGVERRHRDTFLRTVLPALRRKGFGVSKVWNAGNFVTLWRGSEAVDIDFAEEGEPCMTLAGAKTRGFQRCDGLREVVAGLQEVTVAGAPYPAPADAYYERLYGPNWRTPLPSRCRAQ